MTILNERANFRPFEYPKAYEFTKAQNDHHWTHSQIEVDSDVMQYHTQFTEAEKHGINTVLKLFTTYEIHVANYWIDIVYRWFPAPEIRMMAQAFAAMEAEHALFYDKLNNALGLSTKEFYLAFMEDPAMKERMLLLDIYLDKGSTGQPEDLLLSLAAFSFVEGVVLYSSFAFLMSFQRPPKNKLTNVFTGLSYSVRDETLHADADSWIFNLLLKETNTDLNKLKTSINEMAMKAYEIEEKIIDNIFSKGKIEGITEHQLKEFVKSRINKKLKDIGLEALYEVKYNPISSWFYKSINAIEFTDFFSRNPSAYNNNWNFNKITYW